MNFFLLPWWYKIWRNLRKWPQDKITFECKRVGDLEIILVDGLCSIKKQVDIDLTLVPFGAWLAPKLLFDLLAGLHQLAWLEETVQNFEQDSTVDHIFVTQHTPCFPNGGHVRDDMWYNGNNQVRPYIAGKALPKGIIERRDQILDILNQAKA